MGSAAVSELFFSALQTSVSIHLGKQEVEDDNIWTVPSGDFKACKPISDENAEARLAQVIAKQIHHIGFVFNNKHRIFHGIRANS
jgi:hypothetical protein